MPAIDPNGRGNFRPKKKKPSKTQIAKTQENQRAYAQENQY